MVQRENKLGTKEDAGISAKHWPLSGISELMVMASNLSPCIFLMHPIICCESLPMIAVSTVLENIKTKSNCFFPSHANY